MILELIIGSILLGGLIVEFFQEILDWAEAIWEGIKAITKEAIAFIQKTLNAVKKIMVYLKDGILTERVEVTERELSEEDIRDLVSEGALTEEEAQRFIEERRVRIKDFNNN